MLVWNNDEFRLLLEDVKEFKSKKLYGERLNWESVKDNYIQFRNIQVRSLENGHGLKPDFLYFSF